MVSEQLSEHFSREEFERDGVMPDEAVDSYRSLCLDVLERVRGYVGKPIEITSGYRSAAANAAAGGVKNSQHMATDNFCAADFRVAGETNLRPLFDWIRAGSGLPFDQVILEHGASGDVIHASWAKAYRRREALEGATHNQSAYAIWPVENTSA